MEKLNTSKDTSKDTSKETGPKSKEFGAIGEVAIRQSNIENTQLYAGIYRDIEERFKSRISADEDLSYQDFIKWEQGAAYAFGQMTKFQNLSQFSSIYERDSVEKIGYLNPSLSIEAQSGNFYEQRQKALRRAIELSEDKNKEKDLEFIDMLYHFVAEHIYYQYDYETQKIDLYQYNRARQSAHNALIKRLNGINDLARKYAVEPLTFRNFETNDFEYSRTLDSGGYTNARAEYDRASVEAYCRIAFSSDFLKAEKERRWR